MALGDSRPISIDLFCGAGGLSEGLRQAGFETRVGVDFDAHALSTYAANHPSARSLQSDIAKVSGRQLLKLAAASEIDLLAGGPSCQGFSTHGKRIEDDPRNFLFKEFVRLVNEVQPKFFLMENVKGLLVYSKGHFKKLIEDSFDRIGYRVVSATLCAADFGAPQLRHRVMFIGTRLPHADLSFPLPTHHDPSSALVARGSLPYVSVQDAIGDLPKLMDGSNNDPHRYLSDPTTEFQRYARGRVSETVTLHMGKPLSSQAAAIARFVKHGEGLRAVPNEVLPERFQKMRRISSGALRRDCTTLYYRLHPERPAYTITCYYTNVASGPFLHPWEDRSLSHREAARLMSFPDHYLFKPPSLPRQIGNAVPPLMARAVGKHVLGLLRSAQRPQRRAA